MRFIAILALFSSVLLAQNPDGERVSLHITPYWLSGDFTTAETNSKVSPTEFSSKLNIILKLKVPVSKTFTFSPFYEAYNYDYFQELNRTKIESNYYFKKYGMTVSVYF